MINFAALEENITATMAQQKDMTATLARLETTVAALASKAEVDQMEGRLKENLSKASRALERLDVAQQAASQVVQEMPSIQRELTGRMSELEQKLRAAALREKKYVEREAQTARELETMRSSLAQTRTDMERFKEEKEEQFRTDKMIIKQLQCETRSKTTELEAQLLEAQSLLAAKTKQVMSANPRQEHRKP